MTRTPRDGLATIDGLSFHYRDWGGSGQGIILLHGLASTCHIWDLVAPILSADFAVVALDQRGHGESDKPDHGYDFATVTRDLHGFIDSIGLQRPLVVGHSWGADVALEYAVARPEGLTGLCFVDGGTIEISARPDMSLERAKEEMAPPDFTGVTVDQLRERSRKWRLGDSMTPEIRDIVLANFEILEDNTVRARLSRDNHMQIIEAFWGHRPSELYPHVRCPVLLMPARSPAGQPPNTRRFRREEAIAAVRLPRSETVWLEDSIHDVPLQRPDLVAGVIREHIEQGFFA